MAVGVDGGDDEGRGGVDEDEREFDVDGLEAIALGCADGLDRATVEAVGQGGDGADVGRLEAEGDGSEHVERGALCRVQDFEGGGLVVDQNFDRQALDRLVAGGVDGGEGQGHGIAGRQARHVEVEEVGRGQLLGLAGEGDGDVGHGGLVCGIDGEAEVTVVGDRRLGRDLSGEDDGRNGVGLELEGGQTAQVLVVEAVELGLVEGQVPEGQLVDGAGEAVGGDVGVATDGQGGRRGARRQISSCFGDLGTVLEQLQGRTVIADGDLGPAREVERSGCD